jgi:hypothetical protein
MALLSVVEVVVLRVVHQVGQMEPEVFIPVELPPTRSPGVRVEVRVPAERGTMVAAAAAVMAAAAAGLASIRAVLRAVPVGQTVRMVLPGRPVRLRAMAEWVQ